MTSAPFLCRRLRDDLTAARNKSRREISRLKDSLEKARKVGKPVRPKRTKTRDKMTQVWEGEGNDDVIGEFEEVDQVPEETGKRRRIEKHLMRDGSISLMTKGRKKKGRNWKRM